MHDQGELPCAPEPSPGDEDRLAQLSLDGQFMRGIVEATGRAFFLIDVPKGKLVYISPQFERLWGISREHFYNDSTYWYKTIHPDDRDYCRQSASERMDRPATQYAPFDYRIYRGDGELRWIRGNVFSCPHPSTGAPLVCGIAEDVTALKYAEMEADRRREELEATVACRTAELTAANDALREREAYLRKLIQVQEFERELISYDIHDGAIQQLIGAEMHLQAAMSTADAARRDAELTKAQSLMRDVIAETRRVINGIRPQTLDELGVSAAVAELVAEFVKEGLAVDLVDELDSRRWSPMIEVSIYRIVQESLNNVRRHARTDLAKVEMRLVDERIHVTTTDHGRGFDPDRREAMEFGLRGMRERCAAVGGTCAIESVKGKGSTVHAELPTLDPAESATVERDLARHALMLSRARMMSILDRTTAIIFVKDHLLRYELVNRRHEEIFHYKRDQIIGKDDYAFLPPEVANAVRDNDRRVLESGEPITIEEKVPNDGQMREYVVVKFSIPGEQGNPPSVCGIATDITDYNRERRRSAEMERRFGVFMDHLPLPAWLKSADGRYVFVNRKVLEIMRIAPAQAIGKDDSELFPADEAARIRGHDEKVLQTRETLETVDVISDGEGRARTWRSYRFYLESADGSPLVGGVATEAEEE